ncbi:pseudouridine synthase [Gracilibacillus sp. YIM 98692]|uniref:pseudouridine synthase n=1 Tax=Gracilibacillus sp. YIM 98692 TaxID=2663532 RepID=UPI0013D5D3DC|nr:pseudouridine synthase [Gracilibacillus sp. YIM 98692]
MRLDKLLANMGVGSRKDVKNLIKKKKIQVNGSIAKKPNQMIDPEQDEVICNGEQIRYQKYIYLMLHKPKGYISATHDDSQQTVLDLIDPSDKVLEPFPVGRLDKDTEGLLLLTNNGQLAHQLLSPKKHVEKAYIAHVDHSVSSKDIELFEIGIDIGEKEITRPAKLEILDETEANKVKVTISEGKFHQIKRMFHALNNEVTYLKRISMGSLSLDKSIQLGDYRHLTEDEIEKLKKDGT